MKLAFTKMQGAGNDFIVLDNLAGSLSLTADQIRRLCHRRFGIGADGILLLEAPPEAGLDARMVYFNADGSRGEMCGNGARCFASFAFRHGLGADGKVRFLTDAGPIAATAKGALYTIAMTPPVDFRLHQKILITRGEQVVHYVNTGVPHVVRFVDHLDEVDIRADGAELRYHPAFAPKGANANFAHYRPGEPVRIRTYERGVEDETLACGTGVTAVAIISHLVHHPPPPVMVRVAGGDLLEVDWKRDGDRFHNVTLTGPAREVFEGEIEVN